MRKAICVYSSIYGIVFLVLYVLPGHEAEAIQAVSGAWGAICMCILLYGIVYFIV